MSVGTPRSRNIRCPYISLDLRVERYCGKRLSRVRPDLGATRPTQTDGINRVGESLLIVRDANGQALGYFYFEEEPGRQSTAKLLTRDEARRKAVNFAKLPVLRRRK